jgi:ubiquinone biosynthesis protein
MAARAVGTRDGFITPTRLVRVVRSLGPVFIKVGQFLTRPDLIPQEYCDELLKLVDQVPPFPWETARRIITEDLGRDPNEVFAWINQRPLASASLSQVHLARTFDEIDVAVKIQREGIRDAVATDLRRVRWLLGTLQMAGVLPGIRAADLIAELQSWMDRELDMQRERANLQRMYELSAGDETMRIPRPYPEYSGSRVLTQDYIRGVPFSSLLRMTRAGQHGHIAELGLDPNFLSENLIRSVLTQIFRYRFFHGDVHPGNLIAIPGNAVGFVDFGLVDVLDETILRRQAEYISSIYSGDEERIFRALLSVLTSSPNTDLDQFHAEVRTATRAWLRESAAAEVEPARNTHSPVGRYMISILQAARRSRMHLPQEVLGMYRTVLTADAVAGQVGSGQELAAVGRSFFGRLRVEEVVNSLMPESLGPAVLEWLSLARTGPERLNQLLSDLADERFVLQMRTTESREDRRKNDTRAKMITLAILSVSLALVMVAYLHSALLADIRIAVPLGAVLIASYAGVFVLWRRLR